MIVYAILYLLDLTLDESIPLIGRLVEINRRLADDPWAIAQRLVTTGVNPWTVLVGSERLATATRNQP